MSDGEPPSDAPAAPALRASDAERERTATLLREHCAAGRLTPEELAERLDDAYTARTVGELDVLVADLPGDARAGTIPPVVTRPARSAARELARQRVLHVAGQAVLVTVICIAIWLATGTDHRFWPQWVALGMGIRLLLVSWRELGPAGNGARPDETRHGRGGAQPPELRRGNGDDR
ncbi:MAG TPA: DUF1707 domain-containing protein [Conexibacter sp.]|nr:DUF1707 domain-containing protein [Conexibacter sp.]